MEMKDGFLTRQECTAMKGIAILGIVLHNYCHWLKDIARENEYTWLAWKTDRLWDVLQQPDGLLPIHLFSFFGHYGVPVFLFLSGFGMVMKYENAQAPTVSIWRFARYNYLKLLRILIVGFALFTMLDAITPGMHRYQAGEVVGMLGMYANFFEHPSQVVWPGPYWYFSLTLQLYLLYRLSMYRRHWGVVAVLIVVCWLWQEAYIDDPTALERLRYNFIGGMLPFGLGIIGGRIAEELAHRDLPCCDLPCRIPALLCVLLLSIALAGVMSFSIQAWLWVPVFVVTGTVALVKLVPKPVLPYVLWVGNVSAAVFVIHPLVRKIFVRPYIYEDMYAGLLLYIVATLVVSWLVKKLIDQIPSPKL